MVQYFFFSGIGDGVLTNSIFAKPVFFFFQKTLKKEKQCCFFSCGKVYKIQQVTKSPSYEDFDPQTQIFQFSSPKVA